ncbi:MAG: metallophosphoesterase [Lachnospiraceae bacterium]|nr:metallophosphoesterase [Lachnospiraceae bacterium]
MKPWIVILGILVILAVIITIRACYEFVTLARTDYDLETGKLPPGKTVMLAVLSDLHNRTYGDGNQKLLDMVREVRADAILLAGDIFTASTRKDPEPVFAFLRELSEIAPVFYAPGNHERKIRDDRERYNGLYERLTEELWNDGIHYLENSSMDLDDEIRIYGLDMDLSFFPKLLREKKTPPYTEEDVQKDLGTLDRNHYNIVLAHSPKYFKIYAKSGADLVLSGHYHGGAVRIPKVGGVISPQFVLFPKYDKGKYESDQCVMIVSSGCGSHKVHLRLGNKPEVMAVKIHGHFI